MTRRRQLLGRQCKGEGHPPPISGMEEDIKHSFYTYISKIENRIVVSVPDPGSRSRVVVFAGAGCWGNLRRDAGNLEWGGDGKGLRKGRLVHE
jgi:hypothetical protein